MLTVALSCVSHHIGPQGPIRILPRTEDYLASMALNKSATATADSSTPDTVDPLITRFLDAVWMERGLSSNTLAAYRADLVALSRWLSGRHVALPRTSRADLMDFIAARVNAGRSEEHTSE